MKNIPFFVFCREREIGIVTMNQGSSTAFRIPTIDQIVATGFEIENGKVDINKKLLNGVPFDEKIESICLDDGYLVIGFSDGSIGIPTPEKVEIFKVSTGQIWDLAFDSDNHFIVCAGHGLSTFSKTTGEIKRISEVDSYTLALDKKNKRIFYTEVHPRGRYLYSSDYLGNKTRLFPDDCVYLNSINYYKMKFINDLDLLVCATSQGVLFLSNDNTWELLSFSADTYVGFHDVASCRNGYDTETRSNNYTCLDVNQDNSAIALGTTDGKIHIWDVRAKTPITEIVVDALGRSVTSIAWGFDDYFIAIIDYKELISIRNSETINYFFPINDILD
jgi:WD40 repeat protein